MKPSRRALATGISAPTELKAAARDGLLATRVRAGGQEYVILSAPVSASRDPAGQLTAAERAVLVLLLEGRSNAGIAELRSTSLRTVANQVAAIYRKLRVGSRAELAALGPSVSEGPSIRRSSTGSRGGRRPDPRRSRHRHGPT